MMAWNTNLGRCSMQCLVGIEVQSLLQCIPQVICRVLRDVTLEGLVSASLRPSHLSTSATRYEELCAGQVVEGEMMSANEVGIVVKLGEGLRALVRKNDIGEVRVNKPSSRFKVSFYALVTHDSLLCVARTVSPCGCATFRPGGAECVSSRFCVFLSDGNGGT